MNRCTWLEEGCSVVSLHGMQEKQNCPYILKLPSNEVIIIKDPM